MTVRFEGKTAIVTGAGSGIGRMSGGLTPLAELAVDEWERVLRVNLIGVLLVQRAARAMVSRGRILSYRDAWRKHRLLLSLRSRVRS